MLSRAWSPRAALRATNALILREVATSHGRAPGGYLWAVLEPTAGIALLTLIFSLGFRAPPLGESFALFYATGLLCLTFFGDLSGKLAQILPYSRALLRYPSVTFLDALVARFVLTLLTQLTVHALVLGALLAWQGPPGPIAPLPILLAYLALILLALGVGTLNAFLFPAFPLWQSAWSVLTRPLVLVSCVFFIFESVPQPYRDLLWYNPLVHVAGAMREGFYAFYPASYVVLAYPMGIGLLALAAGLFLLERYHRDILDD